MASIFCSDGLEPCCGRLWVQVEEDGIVFFRESCFRQSGDKARKSNPTHYRYACCEDVAAAVARCCVDCPAKLP